MIQQTIDLNLIPDSPPVVVHIDQYDTGEGRLIINLYAGDDPYMTEEGTKVIIQGTKPDGKVFVNEASISGNVVTVDITDQMSAVAGSVRTQVVVTETNGRIGSFVFILRVQHSAIPEDDAFSRSEFGIVQHLVALVESIRVCPPIIGEDENWWLWDVDAECYVDSGLDATSTITISAITMLDEDEEPRAENTGTLSDAVYELFIPRGHTGAKGDTGASPVVSANANIDGTTGTPAVRVEKTGTDLAPVFSFLFSGIKGEPYEYTTLEGTLLAGETSISFTDDEITDNAYFDIYTNNSSVLPETSEVVDHTLTITFEELTTD